MGGKVKVEYSFRIDSKFAKWIEQHSEPGDRFKACIGMGRGFIYTSDFHRAIELRRMYDVSYVATQMITETESKLWRLCKAALVPMVLVVPFLIGCKIPLGPEFIPALALTLIATFLIDAILSKVNSTRNRVYRDTYVMLGTCVEEDSYKVETRYNGTRYFFGDKSYLWVSDNDDALSTVGVPGAGPDYMLCTGTLKDALE